MNTINKALVVALVVQIALAALLLTRDDSTSLGKREPIVPGFAADKVERLVIYKEPVTDKEGDPAIELAKKNGAWAVASHFDYPAEESKVDGLLQKIAGLATRGPMATGKGRQNQLSVADTRYKRKLVVHGAGEPLTLYVGDPAGSRKTAVRVQGSDGIHAVPGFNVASVSAAVAGWVDLQYFSVDPAQIAALTVKNLHGEFSFERDASDEWQLVGQQPAAPQPGQAPAQPAKELDQSAIQTLANAIASVRLAEPADPARAIAEPAATVSIRMKVTPPEAPDGEDGADQPPAVSVAAEQHEFVIGPEEGSRNFLRRTGDPHAILVHASNVSSLVGFTSDKLYSKPEEEAPAAPTPPAPPSP